jgi:hypothetical protein
MTEDRAVREVLSSYLADEPPMNLAVETVLAAGRRRRVVRQAGGTVIGAVAIAGAAFTIALGPTTFGPSVAGSDKPAVVTQADRYFQHSDPVAALIQDRVRAALPDVPLQLTQIYPSDWNHTTALQPSEAKNATVWEAHYIIGGDQQHELWMTVEISLPTHPPTEAELRRTCQQANQSACSYVVGQDGSALVRATYSVGDMGFTRTVRQDRPGNRSVNIQERIQASSAADAAKKWTVPAAGLDKLATDPHLEIPAPEVRPPSPTYR